MDGLGALVTGFTRATVSLDTCPTPKRAFRGHQVGPVERVSSRAMADRVAGF
jgi:hypothetical protein